MQASISPELLNRIVLGETAVQQTVGAHVILIIPWFLRAFDS
jgi:hypothetical protein